MNVDNHYLFLNVIFYYLTTTMHFHDQHLVIMNIQLSVLLLVHVFHDYVITIQV